MFGAATTTFALFALVLPLVAAQGQTCGPGSLCPADAPCCSEYGYCGTGTFCLGGCNSMWSNTLTSCRPEPICQNANHTFPNLDRILSNSTLYDGNATEYDWVVSSGTVLSSSTGGGEIVLTLTETNGGTLMSSTRYVQYGTISASLKAGSWNGVVVAFILMSDVKDEIDWEFPGDQVTEGQTNYFWMGTITDPTHGFTATNITDNSQNFHTYTFDWQESQLNWLVDGNVVHSVTKASTADASAGGRDEYPSTPARVQLSIWPAGIPTESSGVVEWAGGNISWTDPSYVANGYFSAVVQSVSIECAPLSFANTTPELSYVYTTNSSQGIPQVLITNSSTMVNGAMGRIGGGATGWGWGVGVAIGGLVLLGGGLL